MPRQPVNTGTGTGTRNGGTRPTRRITSALAAQRPALAPMDIIGNVALFASTGADLKNICVAVGRNDARIVRSFCLRNNVPYLRRIIEKNILRRRRQVDFWDTYFDPVNKENAKEGIRSWMEVNEDWKELCTAERVEDERLAYASYVVADERRVVARKDYLILFNNPAVAIELGLIDVLKHLVEEVGIDINACNRWNAYTTLRRCRQVSIRTPKPKERNVSIEISANAAPSTHSFLSNDA